MLLQRPWKQFFTFTMLLEDWAGTRLSELQPNCMKTESGLCYGAVRPLRLLNTSVVKLWSFRVLEAYALSHFSAGEQKENSWHGKPQKSFWATWVAQISLPDASLVRYFGPAFLNDVVHQVPLWNSLLGLPVFLKGFHLGTQNSSNILPFKNIQVFHAQLSSTLMLSAENTQNSFILKSQYTLDVGETTTKKSRFTFT